MISFPVYNRYTNKIRFTAKIDCPKTELQSVKLGLAVKWAIQNKADLTGADLTRANLTEANLTEANLSESNLTRANLAWAILTRANLTGANLSESNLTRANLTRVNLTKADISSADLTRANFAWAILTRANLSEADISSADLAWANLTDVNLFGANLTGADFTGANLSEANLTEVNLSGANLTGANLTGANLTGAKNIPTIAITLTSILPEGALIGYKKGKNNEIIRLQIPSLAKRSNATGRKCRAEYARVLSIRHPNGNLVSSALSQRNDFIYTVGKIVEPIKPFDENRWNECTSGIHFFITEQEAENY